MEAMDDLRTAQALAREQGLPAPSESAPAATPQPKLPPNPFRNSQNATPPALRLIGVG